MPEVVPLTRLLLALLIAVTLVNEPGAQPRTLVAEADLDGDGQLEIVWMKKTHGAHTEHAWVYVSSGAPGHPELPGTPVRISTPEAVFVQGQDLVLKGGLVTSVGAGQAQRSRLDTYRWDGEKIALADRRFAPSPFSYHRLQDGIVAEQFRHVPEAKQSYTDAMQPRRIPLPFEMASPHGDLNAQLGTAVRTFARLRLGLLLWREGSAREAQTIFRAGGGPFRGLLTTAAGATDPAAACTAAAAWAERTPAFLEALNSPYGYANPRWEPALLCGPLPETG